MIAVADHSHKAPHRFLNSARSDPFDVRMSSMCPPSFSFTDGDVLIDVPELHRSDRIVRSLLADGDRDCGNLEVLRVDERVGAERRHVAPLRRRSCIGVDQPRERRSEIARGRAAPAQFDALRVLAFVGRIDRAEEVLRRLLRRNRDAAGRATDQDKERQEDAAASTHDPLRLVFPVTAITSRAIALAPSRVGAAAVNLAPSRRDKSVTARCIRGAAPYRHIVRPRAGNVRR